MMIKVLNSPSFTDSGWIGDVFKATKCGDIYVNDESTDAYLLCSFCVYSSDKQKHRTIEEFIDHIKWHRSDDEHVPLYETLVPQIIQDTDKTPEGNPIELNKDKLTESTEKDVLAHMTCGSNFRNPIELNEEKLTESTEKYVLAHMPNDSDFRNPTELNKDNLTENLETDVLAHMPYGSNVRNPIENKEKSTKSIEKDVLAHMPYDTLFEIIDLFSKCPCLWHRGTAECEQKFIEPAKIMITKFFNKLTKGNESVEHVAELLQGIKSECLAALAERNDETRKDFHMLKFLLHSEQPSLDQSIYTDFSCTICKQQHRSWECLWDHLCDCHMDIEEDDLNSNEFKSENELDVNLSEEDNEHHSDNVEYLLEFIETYKTHSNLWDKTHPQYSCRTLRDKSYSALIAVMKKYNHVATRKSCTSKIRCIKAQFVYAYRKMKLCEEHNQQHTFTPIWYWDKLFFLTRTFTQKKENPQTHGKTESTESLISPEKPSKTKSFLSSTCIVCKKRFPNVESCLDHMECGHEKRAFQSPDGFFYCPLCNCQNKSKYSLMRHLRHSHTSGFRECDDCGMKFRFLTSFARHKAVAHKDLRPFKCLQCRKGFGNLSQLKTHSIIHWTKDERPHSCYICGTKFTSRTNLTVHIKRHTKDYKISCKICGRKMATVTELKSHTVTHTKEYDYICDVCGKGYRSQRHLSIHQAEDHYGLTYDCDLCGSKFKTKRSLRKHLDGHTTFPELQCKDCGRQFAQTGPLRRHIRRSHKQLDLVNSSQN